MSYKQDKLGIPYGGTGQSTQTAAFDALAPNTTKGDLIVYNGTDNVRLAAGTDGQALKANSATATGLEWGSDTSGLADPGANGVVVRTALNTTTARTITGTTNQVSVSNGDGVSGNPTLSLPQDINSSANVNFGSVTTSGAVEVNGRFTAQGAQVVTAVTPGAGNYNVTATDYAILKTGITGGGDTINLEAAATAGGGRVLVIKDATGTAGTNNITIEPDGSETIDGASNFVMNTNYGAVTLACDGSSGWYVM